MRILNPYQIALTKFYNNHHNLLLNLEKSYEFFPDITLLKATTDAKILPIEEKKKEDKKLREGTSLVYQTRRQSQNDRRMK